MLRGGGGAASRQAGRNLVRLGIADPSVLNASHPSSQPQQQLPTDEALCVAAARVDVIDPRPCALRMVMKEV